MSRWEWLLASSPSASVDSPRIRETNSTTQDEASPKRVEDQELTAFTSRLWTAAAQRLSNVDAISSPPQKDQSFDTEREDLPLIKHLPEPPDINITVDNASKSPSADESGISQVHPRKHDTEMDIPDVADNIHDLDAVDADAEDVSVEMLLERERRLLEEAKQRLQHEKILWEERRRSSRSNVLSPVAGLMRNEDGLSHVSEMIASPIHFQEIGSNLSNTNMQSSDQSIDDHSSDEQHNSLHKSTPPPRTSVTHNVSLEHVLTASFPANIQVNDPNQNLELPSQGLTTSPANFPQGRYKNLISASNQQEVNDSYSHRSLILDDFNGLCLKAAIQKHDKHGSGPFLQTSISETVNQSSMNDSQNSQSCTLPKPPSKPERQESSAARKIRAKRLHYFRRRAIDCHTQPINSISPDVSPDSCGANIPPLIIAEVGHDEVTCDQTQTSATVSESGLIERAQGMIPVIKHHHKYQNKDRSLNQQHLKAPTSNRNLSDHQRSTYPVMRNNVSVTSSELHHGDFPATITCNDNSGSDDDAWPRPQSSVVTAQRAFPISHEVPQAFFSSTPFQSIELVKDNTNECSTSLQLQSIQNEPPSHSLQDGDSCMHGIEYEERQYSEHKENRQACNNLQLANGNLEIMATATRERPFFEVAHVADQRCQSRLESLSSFAKSSCHSERKKNKDHSRESNFNFKMGDTYRSRMVPEIPFNRNTETDPRHDNSSDPGGSSVNTNITMDLWMQDQSDRFLQDFASKRDQLFDDVQMDSRQYSDKGITYTHENPKNKQCCNDTCLEKFKIDKSLHKIETERSSNQHHISHSSHVLREHADSGVDEILPTASCATSPPSVARTGLQELNPMDDVVATAQKGDENPNNMITVQSGEGKFNSMRQWQKSQQRQSANAMSKANSSLRNTLIDAQAVLARTKSGDHNATDALRRLRASQQNVSFSNSSDAFSSKKHTERYQKVRNHQKESSSREKLRGMKRTTPKSENDKSSTAATDRSSSVNFHGQSTQSEREIGRSMQAVRTETIKLRCEGGHASIRSQSKSVPTSKGSGIDQTSQHTQMNTVQIVSSEEPKNLSSHEKEQQQQKQTISSITRQGFSPMPSLSQYIHLQDLPDETILYIMSFLPGRSLFNLALASRRFAHLLNDPLLFKKIILFQASLTNELRQALVRRSPQDLPITNFASPILHVRLYLVLASDKLYSHHYLSLEATPQLSFEAPELKLFQLHLHITDKLLAWLSRGSFPSLAAFHLMSTGNESEDSLISALSSLTDSISDVRLEMCTEAGDACLIAISRRFRKLKKLVMTGSLKLTKRGIAAAAKYLTQLRELNLGRSRNASASWLKCISRSFTHLKVLRLQDCAITDESLRWLQSSKFNLELVDLKGCSACSEDGIADVILQHSTLKEVCVSQTAASTTLVQRIHFEKLHHCLRIIMQECYFEEEDLLAILNHLDTRIISYLDVRSCSLSFSASALRSIQCKILY
eukprot:gene10486-2616_t